MANDMVKQGIAVENYPQYGTNFWGDSANNYGFGNSNIGQYISTKKAAHPKGCPQP